MALATVALFALLVVLAGSALAAGDVNQETCEAFPETEASPGFSSVLPDCRAFELVSPPYSGGMIPVGYGNVAPQMSPDGEHLLATSFSALAETGDLGEDGTEYGANYVFSRTPAGWTAEALEPPASQYPLGLLEEKGVDPTEPGRSVWEVAVPAHSGEAPEEFRTGEWVNTERAMFAIREPEGDGKAHFTVMGPTAAPGHENKNGAVENAKLGFVAGASADVTHIVFEVQKYNAPELTPYLWPGDKSVAGAESSWYEYRSGGGSEPVLIGVKNKGAPPWKSGAEHINEGSELVSECGTKFDAISASGERVFFTAQHVEGCAGVQPAVDEVYARANGSETLKISGAGSAEFSGASEDGSKVFYTEEGRLYEYDFEAPEAQRRTLLASEVTAVSAVAPDGTRVYFESTAILTSTPNGNGETPTSGGFNLYSYATEAASRQLSFVASTEGPQSAGSASFDPTRDGGFLVFKSTVRDLKGAEDTSGAAQLFEYDAATGTVERVSIGQHSAAGYECEATGAVEQGYDCDGNTSLAEDAPRMVEAPDSSVAEDGTVAFSSELALTPQAVQGRILAGQNEAPENVYEYRPNENQVYLISPGDEPTPASYQDARQGQTRLFGIDESSRDIFFSSVDSLVPQDTDSQSSWYDARVGGGFPAPASTLSCSGEACQGPSPGPPVFSAPASNTLTASGNLASPVESKPVSKPATKPKAKPCRKGFVKKKDKCVKASKSKRAKKASTKRGTKS